MNSFATSRARIAGAFRARGLLAEDALDASEVRLEIDGYELLDECLARDVVRDDDVVRARRRADAGRRADARASPRAIGDDIRERASTVGAGGERWGGGGREDASIGRRRRRVDEAESEREAEE